jgi:hypothetical protein
MYRDCIVERRKTVQHNTIHMYSGAITKRGETVEIEACGTPLFTEGERILGVCRSCITGWEADGNIPTPRGRDQIRRAKQ